MSKSILSDCLARAAMLVLYKSYRHGYHYNTVLMSASSDKENFSHGDSYENEHGRQLRVDVRRAIEKVLANYNHTDSEEQLMP